MFNQNFKVMKQRIFTIVMLFALVIFAGSANAQTKFTPYQGGTYTYNLPYTLVNAGNVALTLTGGEMTVGTTVPAGITNGGAAVALASGTGSVSVPITFALTASGTKRIAFVVTDLTSNCSNNIFVNVVVATAPTLSFTIAASAFTCQGTNSSPANNTPASSGVTDNTFTYTITPSVSIASGYTYGVDFDITPTTSGLTAFAVTRTTGDGSLTGSYATGYSITGATSATQVFTVTFTTTTGIANEVYTGTISAPKLNVTAGGNIYDGTIADPDDVVTVRTMPTVGAIN
jgi:hypothetical protein